MNPKEKLAGIVAALDYLRDELRMRARREQEENTAWNPLMVATAEGAANYMDTAIVDLSAIAEAMEPSTAYASGVTTR